MSERWRKFPSSALLIVCSTFNLLYSFFWVIPQRLNFKRRRFGTLGLFHHHRRCKSMKMEQSVPKRRNIKFRHQEITQKKEHNIQNMAKVWNQVHLFCIWISLETRKRVNIYLYYSHSCCCPDSSASIYQDYLSLIIDEQKYNTKGISYVLFPEWNRKLFLTGLKVSDVYAV